MGLCGPFMLMCRFDIKMERKLRKRGEGGGEEQEASVCVEGCGNMCVNDLLRVV